MLSHHPPVTAYCIWNEQHGVRLEGYNAQKASFKTTINVKVGLSQGITVSNLTPHSKSAMQSSTSTHTTKTTSSPSLPYTSKASSQAHPTSS